MPLLLETTLVLLHSKQLQPSSGSPSVSKSLKGAATFSGTNSRMLEFLSVDLDLDWKCSIQEYSNLRWFLLEFSFLSKFVALAVSKPFLVFKAQVFIK